MKKKNAVAKKHYPMVSVCTPTFNRRPFIQNMFACFLNQTYPKNRIEWIIVDDGSDKIKDLIDKSNIPQIRYFAVDKKMTLGAKRNYMHSFVRGSIVVYMDDDDYYPPERIQHAVEKLQGNTGALCAGSSEIYIYFKHIQKMYQCGPYGPNHATAGTFAFRTELLKQTKYEEHAALAEERAFLKDYSIPFVQLDPLKSILVFSHEHNTFDKRKMLDAPHPDYMKESPKTVETFIRHSKEAPIKKFFMEEIDAALAKYEPGLPAMKPDVLVQIKEIEANRQKMIEEEMKKRQDNGAPILLQRPGEQPVALSQQDVVNIMQQQQNQLNQMHQQMNELQQENDRLKQITLHPKGPIVLQPPGETPKTLSQQEAANIMFQQHQSIEQSQSRITELEKMVELLQKQLVERIKLSQTVSAELTELKTKLQDSFSVVTAAAVAKELEPKKKSDPEFVINL
jgi:hypothetical protein